MTQHIYLEKGELFYVEGEIPEKPVALSLNCEDNLLLLENTAEWIAYTSALASVRTFRLIQDSAWMPTNKEFEI